MQVGGSMIEDPVLAAEARHDYLQSECEKHWDMYETTAEYKENLQTEFEKLVRDPDNFWEAWGYEGFSAYAPADRIIKIESDLMTAVIEEDYDYLGRFISSQFTHYFTSTAEDKVRENYDHTTH